MSCSVSTPPWAGLSPAPFGLVALCLSLALITAGLLSSTWHLGHPARAWRALSQWRSSWLSREGVAAIVTYVPALSLGWLWMAGERGAMTVVLALLSAFCALVTVCCTAMIYGSLRSIQAWCNRWVLPAYVALGLMTGCLALYAVSHWCGRAGPPLGLAAIATILAAGGIKLAYWRELREGVPGTTAQSATGLQAFGTVSLLQGPHSQGNYLLREMGYRIARKHAARLRTTSLVCGFALPLALCLACLLTGEPAATLAATAAACLAGGGVLIERWLFFAEAHHSVMAYYGG